MPADGPWLAIAVAFYLGAALAAFAAGIRDGDRYGPALGLLALALAFHTAAIVLRWDRLGHGPYVNMFEILSSNVWSLHLAVFAAALAIRPIRPSLATALPVLQILVWWLVAVTPVDSQAPVTYDTVWLPVHLTLGKIFLGCTVVAVGLSLIVLMRAAGTRVRFAAMPDSATLDELAYRFLLIAFIFHSLMLAAGAVWAQDAWGRYWAWDPLETWAFVTWLCLGAYLHLRVTRRPHPVWGAVMVIGIFAVAFSTFFGMPFVSTAPHKGAV